MSAFDSLATIRPLAIWQGAVARPVQGEHITLAVVDLVPDQDVPEHRHGNEQVGIVLRGSITMTIAGESRSLSTGETYVIPGGIPHSAVSGPEGASVIDVFTPVRADWQNVERLQPSKGSWPT
jgi:quercetin dioxygenase-like cupin family protein